MSNRSRTGTHLSVAELDAALANSRAGGTSRHFWLPFHLVEPAVFAADLILVTGLSLLTGLGYHWLFLDRVPEIEPYIAVGVLAFSNFSAILAARGDYRFRKLVNFRRQAKDVTLIWSGVFLVLLGIAFSLKVTDTYSRGATIGFFALGMVALLAWRGLLAHLLAHALASGAFAERKVIVIGERDRLASSRLLPKLRQCGYKPVRIFEIRESESTASGVPQSLRDTLNAAIEFARADTVEDIVLMVGWEHSRCIESILNVLSVLPVPVHLLPDENVARYLGHRMVHVGDTWTAELKRAPLSESEQVLKRGIDIIAAGIGLVLLSPMMLVTAISIVIDSGRPILFTQSRNGFNGRSFRIFKFRTMKVLEDGPVIRQATRDDPRLTRLGRWLRRTNLDELPQLFNVLRGEMSLVGPRPHAAAHNTEYEERIAVYAFRYHVKPGITGWAQVNGFRGETRTVDMMAKRVDFDLWYINNWSIWLDIRILFRTLIVGLQPSAY